MNYKVYLVEDENDLNEVLTSYLKNEGWEVESFVNGKQALEKVDDNPHLWILDIMLPDTDGFQIIKKIKEYNHSTPVIFISARDAELDRVVGLEMGGDDYIAKPFLPRELVIRVKNLLKKTYEYEDRAQKTHNLTIGPYEMDMGKRLVLEDGNEIDLSSKEFDLLVLFVKNTGRAFSRKQILDNIWGEDYFGSDRVVDDLMRRLRKKVCKLKIETLYGYGYRMVD